MITNLLRLPFGIKSPLFHLLIWVLFIIYDSVIGGLARGGFGSFSSYAIHYVINISLFYFHAYIILRYSLYPPNQVYWRLPLFIMGEVLLYVILVFNIDLYLATNTDLIALPSYMLDGKMFFSLVWRGLYFMLFSTGYFFFIRYKTERDHKEKAQRKQLNEQIRREKIERELVEARNAFLLAQINPHFLFNTLNYIYFTANPAAPQAGTAILALSKIMRYSANIQNANTLVAINEEIDYIQTLIFLHQMRHGERVNFSFQYNPEVKKVKIIPLVLITFAENIFKHAHLSHSTYPPVMKIYLDGESKLKISTANYPKTTHINSTGLKSGLDNIKKRLWLMYNDKATLTFGFDENNCFKLDCSIQLS